MCLQGVQAGGGPGGSTVISWVVDDDNSVVKYCQDNIVSIYVPGGSEETSGDNDENDEDVDIPALAIVANNTLRLRIVPCDPDHLGWNCADISHF